MSTKLCECGCGQPTNLAPQSNSRFGWVKGQPLRYLRGHANKGRHQEPLDVKWELDPATGCWVWQRGKTSDGYAMMSALDGRGSVRAHRLIYKVLRGDIPEGLSLDHLCRNRACVNPFHLEPVTVAENNRRAPILSTINAAKTECARGHPLSGENLYMHGGKRHCRTCRREWKHRQSK